MARRNAPPRIAVFGEFNPAEIAAAANKGAEATERAAARLERMRELFRSNDEIDLLARLAFLCIIGSPSGRATRREPFVRAHELELLRTIALNGGRVERRDTAGTPQVVQDLRGLVSEHTGVIREMSFTRLGNDAEKSQSQSF